MSKSDKQKFQTEDGYVFYAQPDGTWTDHEDPEKSDMIFNSKPE